MCISSSKQTQIVTIKVAKRHGKGVIQSIKGGQEQNIRQNLNQGQIYGGPIKQGTVNMIA
jgi:hypothetical protein